MRKTDLWESRAPKSRNAKTTCANPFRDFAYRDFTICEDKALASRCPGCRNTETLILVALYSFRGFILRGFASRDFGGCDDRRSHIEVFWGPNSEILTLNMLPCFGVSAIGISGYATTGGLALRFPGSRNSKAPSFNTLHYFGNSSIGISRVGGFETGEHVGPALRYPRCRNTEI
jgi:hypothetical protein